MSTAGEISGRKAPQYYSEPRSHDRHGQDWYIEPAWAVELLLDAESFAPLVWDPCAGSGTIPRCCAARGIATQASDIVLRNFPLQYVEDFLAIPPIRGTIPHIIMNPPYRQAEAFVRHALKIARTKVAVLVQAKFPYSQRRYKLFTEHPPHTIYFLSTRPSMPPGELLMDGTVEAHGGKVDYCWICWRVGYAGPTTCRWLLRGAQ